jgi:GDP-L-fucose synthase
MELNAKIYVAGHRGMVGSAILRKLEQEGYSSLITRTSAELDLRNQQQVNSFFEDNKPEYIFLAAAKVGGINANNVYKADFIYENLLIEANVIHAAYKNAAKKLLFLGSSCIYPKLAAQPISEDSLLTGSLEATNEPYAIAKIAGIKLCDSYRFQYGCNFISAMPTNLYGPNDHYDLNNSHVLPAMLRKFITAKRKQLPSVELWGSGTPRREFLHADDIASACLHLMNTYNEPGPINVGTGEDISIKDLAYMIREIAGYEGELLFNTSMPDGTPRKLLDVSKLTTTGWKSTIPLEEGIRAVYAQIKDTIWD